MEKSGLKNVKLADIRPYAKNPRMPAHASIYMRMVRDLGEQERRGQGA